MECPDREYKMHGWLNDENKKRLKELLSDFEKPVVLEIGCWLGMSAEYMLKLNDKLQLITIDIFKESKDFKYFEDLIEIINSGLYEQAVRNLWKYKDRLVIMPKKSENAIRELWYADLKPDLIYIDGSHQYEDVMSDIALSHTYFKNAIICGDDTNIFSVKKALRDFEMLNRKKVYMDNNFWIIE